MKAILTRYIGPTNTKGSRIVATAEGGHRHVIVYDSADSSEAAHRKAACELCDKLGWKGTLIAGGLPDGSVAHVFA